MNPGWLVEREITLTDGTTALLSYDKEGDMLEVFFAEGAATGTVELADGVLLRLNVEHARPLSLAFLCVSPLVREQVYGPPLLQLDGIHGLPDGLRQTIIQIILSPPVNAILKVYSYLPDPQARTLPVASLERDVVVTA